MLPDFDENGLLPPGDYELTLSQLRASLLVEGSGTLPGWDSAWRLKLVENPRSRRAYNGYPKRQLPMWHAYRVELYPHYGQGSGIKDKFGHELEFPSAFRQSRRDGRSKGIVRIGGD